MTGVGRCKTPSPSPPSLRFECKVPLEKTHLRRPHRAPTTKCSRMPEQFDHEKLMLRRDVANEELASGMGQRRGSGRYQGFYRDQWRRPQTVGTFIRKNDAPCAPRRTRRLSSETADG